MKLASMLDGTLDGSPRIVSKDMRWCMPVHDLAPTMLRLIEQWDEVSPELETRYASLQAGEPKGREPFDPARAAAPLPRSPQWLDGSAFLSHGQRMVKAFHLSDKTLNIDYPLMYQGTSDGFLGARASMPLPSEEHGIDLEGELTAIVGPVAMSVCSEDAIRSIKLLALINDVSLRNLLFAEMSMGFGMIHCKPTSVFSPVCVTPDELGAGWREGRAHLNMKISVNDVQIGDVSGGEMAFSFPQLIAHAAKTRSLAAGTVIGSGTFSNADKTRGVACLAEKRALEILDSGAATTGWLRFGDRVKIEMLDEQGHSVFGAIDHTFEQAN